MGFFNDLGKGIANVVKAPFEAVGALAQGVGHGISDILHGAHGQNSQNYLAQMGQHCGCNGNAQFGMQLQQLQQALMLGMAMQAMMQQGGAQGCGCRGGYA